MVGAPRQATFVVVDATSSSRRLAARALRRLGFVNLVTGVFWTSAVRGRGRQVAKLVSSALRRELRGEPFVAVVFRGEAPVEAQARWIVSDAHHAPEARRPR